jgi:RNA polymerase sigma factor (TIGR02999 family)
VNNYSDIFWELSPMNESRNAARRDVTEILCLWQQGDDEQLNRLISELYDDFLKMARAHLRPGGRGLTLMSPTVLVHEACLKLMSHRPDRDRTWRARAEFFGLVSSVMLSVLADYVKSRKALRHGGHLLKITFDSQDRGVESADLLVLRQVLERLGELDRRQLHIWQCRHLCGLSIAELSDSFSMAESSIYRELKAANAWIRVQLGRVNHAAAGV